MRSRKRAIAVAKMDKTQVLQELLAILEGNGVVIRRDRFGGSGGGLCKIKDEILFFLDSDASGAESSAICAKAVAETVDIENIYIKPEVREFIEKFRDKG